jgi:hypothetical protein
MTREPSRLVGAIVFGAAALVIVWRAVSIAYGFAD